MLKNLRSLTDPRAWIFIMLGVGGLWLLWVIIAAGQTPGGQEDAVIARAKGSTTGFVPTFPPRPIPDYPLLDGDGAETSLRRVGGRIALVQFHPRRCTDCEMAAAALEKLSPRDGLVVLRLAMSGATPSAKPAFQDHIGSFDTYVRGRRAVTILYDSTDNSELGRFTNASNLASADVSHLIDQLLVETLRP